MRTLEEVISFIDGYVSAISTNDAELDKEQKRNYNSMLPIDVILKEL